MPVEDTAHRVGDRLVEVVPLDEDGVKAGDATALEVAGPLQKPRERGEDARGVPLGGRGLADGETDLAHRHGETGGGVHHEEHLLPLRLEVFGDGGRDIGAAHAYQGRLVARRHHDHRFSEPLRLQVLLDELAQLAAALSDQGDHVDVRLGVAGDHAEEGRLADAGAGHDADPLTFAAGQKPVDGADAEVQRLPDRAALHRVHRKRVDRVLVDGLDGPLVVDGVAQAVDDPPEKGRSHPQGRLLAADRDDAAKPHPPEFPQRHEQGLVLAEADHLGGYGGVPLGVHLADAADRGLRAEPLDHEPHHLGHLPVETHRLGRLDHRQVACQINPHRFHPPASRCAPRKAGA